MSNTTKTKNALNWFEIPMDDFGRGRKFYETILNAKLQDSPMSEGGQMAIFPYDEDEGIGGSITKMEGCAAPAAGGVTVYLNVEGDIDGVLSRIPAAGGKVLRPKMPIPPHGFIAILQDTEGNSVGIHSMT
jgi:predicted enzyme related to lactoylglutathione lyase